jgi:branched-chain amino acid transport system ATP-binding protein
VYRTLAEIRDAGTSLLIVEQHVGHALDLADEVVVLTHGEVAYHGDANSDLGDVSAKILTASHED